MDIFDYFTQQFEYNPIVNNDKIKLPMNSKEVIAEMLLKTVLP